MNLIGAIRDLRNQVMTGRNLSSKTKIFKIIILRYLQTRSPHFAKKTFDRMVYGMMVETDVKFFIRTFNDFYLFSVFWEKELQHALTFNKGMNFLDIGAHIGKYSLRAALQIGGEGRVIAVEPNKETFSVLVRNLGLNNIKNCIPLNIAAYYGDAELTLFFGETAAQSSVVENFGQGYEKVHAKAMDNVLSDLHLDHLDLVKVDVEGAEFEVLQGLQKTLAEMNPVVIVELIKRDERKVMDFMKSIGYAGEDLYKYLPFRGGLMFYRFKKSSVINN